MAGTDTLERVELLGMCERLGYDETLREEDFPVWQEDLLAEVACFAASERKDMETATMVAGTAAGDRARDRHFAVARALAAPICLLRTREGWDVFSVRAGREPAKRLGDSSSPDRNPSLARFLAPSVLLAAKREMEQLSLLEIDVALLDTARGAAGRELDKRVRRVIAGLLDTSADESAAEAAARVVVRALTALAARDKLTKDRSLASAFARIEELSPDHLQGSDRREVAALAEELGQGLNFATLDPALLGDVYERAVLIPARRLDLGAYYTPPELGRRMINHMPIEHVAPTERCFLDPSCGSGTLLLSANDRLMASLLDEPDDRRRHDYAAERLVGADNDPFAVELARLALFLQAMPYGNGYRVEQRDALVARDEESTATFTVSNPPWAFKRRDGTREQIADQFLRRLVQRTRVGGFLSCVLPVSWLTDDTSRASRRWLRERADVFEVWRLPTRSFRSSVMAPCVVFAHVGRPSTSAYVFRNVWNSGRDRFRDEGIADEVHMVALRDTQAPLTATWLDDLPELRDAMSLRDVAEIRDGAPVANINRLDKNGPHRLLRRYGDVAPFGTVDESVLVRCRYPEDFSKRGDAASPHFYLQPKVLVSAISSVDVPWRLRAFLDPIGVIPRNSMYAVVPRERDDEALIAMLGVLSSAVASLWVAHGTTTRMVNARRLAGLPVPQRSTWPDLAEAARGVITAYVSGAPLEEAVRELDDTVFSAYGLPSSSRRLVARAMAGHKAPEGVVRFPPLPPPKENGASPILRAGAVVDVREGEVRLDVPGLTKSGGEWIETPPHLLGWLARAGATFDVLVSGNRLADARFQFQDDSWMSFEQVLSDYG
jgi:hypothetical protein